MLIKPFYTLREIVQPHGLFPVSRSTWFRGIKKGIYPKPIKGYPFGNKLNWSKNDLNKLYEAIENHPSQSGDKDD